jgi:hypothetical protein
MSMVFRDIRELYRQATQEDPRADQAWTLHLTEGYRKVASMLDVPELRQPEASFVIQEDPATSGEYLDYFDTDADVYAISNLFNATSGQTMHPEPGGMAGRDRYLEPTGDDTSRPRPPAGEVTHWTRQGNRIYVRDRPKISTRIEIRFHIQVPLLSESMLEEHPRTPDQYDLAIAQAAAESFYSVNPAINRMSPEGGGLWSQFFGGEASRKVAEPKDPRALEDRTSQEVWRLAGYSTSPRSGRR